MMIMRFHKLIQSRLLWLVFLGVIVVSFVGWGVASNNGQNQQNARLRRTVATIDGKDLSFQKLDVTRRLMENQFMQRIPEADLTEMALNRLAMVAYAEKAGFDVPMDLAKQQFAMNFAGADGVVDKDSLQNFRNSLRNSLVTEDDHIRFTRDNLMLSHLQRMLSSYVLVPGFDVDRWAVSQTDSYTVQFAPLTPEILEEEVEVGEEEIQSYFQENIGSFLLPEKRRVRYLAVEGSAFADQVKEISEEQARAYYLERPELYVRSVNRPAEEEGAEDTTVQETIPFEEVKAQITETLRMEQARKLAEDTAMSFAVFMTPRRGRPGKSLEAIAEENGLEIRTTEAFAPRDPLPELPDSAAFKQEVFKLDMSDLGRRGGPVSAGDQFVVMELVEIIPPREPKLEEVAERVESAAQSHYTRKAVEAKAAELTETIRNQVAEGADFEESAKNAGLNVISPPPFEMRNMNPNQPMLPRELLQAATAAKSGEVIGPISSRFGSNFIGYLAARTPNPEAAADLSPQVRNWLSSDLHFPEINARFQERVIEPMIGKIEPESGAVSNAEESGE